MACLVGRLLESHARGIDEGIDMSSSAGYGHPVCMWDCEINSMITRIESIEFTLPKRMARRCVRAVLTLELQVHLDSEVRSMNSGNRE